MERQVIASSAIVTAGWEDGDMEVEFAQGQVYAASGVPEMDWQAFLTSPSAGRFFTTYLKNAYTWVQI